MKIHDTQVLQQKLFAIEQTEKALLLAGTLALAIDWNGSNFDDSKCYNMFTKISTLSAMSSSVAYLGVKVLASKYTKNPSRFSTSRIIKSITLVLPATSLLGLSVAETALLLFTGLSCASTFTIPTSIALATKTLYTGVNIATPIAFCTAKLATITKLGFLARYT